MRISKIVVFAVSMVLLASVSAFAGLEVNEENFPDSVFREYVSSDIDTDKDGTLSDEEIAAVTSIDLFFYGIDPLYGRKLLSLEGIEYFTALTELDCGLNSLTELDVSHNTALTHLYCHKNQLTALDISHNTALTVLHCEENQLTELDVSHNTALTELHCGENKLTALDVSNNTALEYLDCYYNQLTALDVRRNTALTHLYCDSNQLTELDVSNNTALTRLSCGSNQLMAFDVRNNTALFWLSCGDNQLTTLDVSNNTALAYLWCSSNQLTTLDVSNNTALTYLWCYSNQLTALDVSNNTDLTTLSCDSQAISEDLVSTGRSDYPYSFNMSSLSPAPDISRVSDTASNVSCYMDSSTGIIYFASAPSYMTYNYNTGYSDNLMDVTVNFGSREENPSPANSIALTDSNFPDSAFRNYIAASFDIDSDGYLSNEEISAVHSLELSSLGTSDLTGIDRFTNLERLICPNNQLSALDISHNPALLVLNCNNNYLETLDVSNNSLLQQLSCANNRITALDVSSNPELNTLTCGELDLDPSSPYDAYNIAALDLSNNPKLAHLYCYGNQLRTIDVSNNPSLNYFDCGSNDLTFLDVSNNPNITTLYCTDNMLPAVDLTRNSGINNLHCETQAFTISAESSGMSDFPYMLNLNTAKSALGVDIDIQDFIANLSNVKITDSSGSSVEFRVDGDIVYFAARPANIAYLYNTGYSDNLMDVTVALLTPEPIPNISDDIPSKDVTPRRYSYSFEIPSGVSAKLAALFGGSIYQFSDDEIISDSWELGTSDLQAISSLNENVILTLPHVQPKNSGVYVLMLTLDGADAGKLLNLHGISDSEGGSVVLPSVLENMSYVFLDENGNEIDRVPDDGVVYAAMNLSANRTHKSVITSVNELDIGTITPYTPPENVIEKIADTINVSVDEIRTITDENIDEPQEPTPAMRSEMESQNAQVIGKLNTLTVSEDGYYVFRVTLSDDLYEQIKGVSISDFKMYALYDDGTSDQVNTSLLPGLLNTWELLSLSGEKLEFGAREFLMVGLLQAGKPFSVYLAKILLMLLAGGCNLGGLGLAGFAVITSAIFIFRRR